MANRNEGYQPVIKKIGRALGKRVWLQTRPTAGFDSSAACHMKRCTKCKLNKPKGDFGKNKHRADGLQTECRECKRQSNREYYSKNKTHHVKVCAAIKRRRVKETHKWMLDYLLKHPCIDCGEQDPRCLEFDHVKDKKKYNVSCMAGLGYGIKSIQREIDKCEVRCANCHRKKTAEEMRWFTSLRARS